ncbi:ANTAR domain-containing protein [Mycolicibacterium moriokaense]|nr:ANTAR domain-containing protein [Mycolicibacterium moriokaense]
MYQVLELVDGLQRRGQADFDAALHEINQNTVASVPGAQYAGITIVDGDGTVTTLAATHPYPGRLDDIQRDVREGPCLSAAWSQHLIRIEDMAAEVRWPRYRDAAMRDTPVRSVASFQLFGDGNKIAALNLYAERARAFDEESIETGLIFAAHTTVAWNTMQRQEQFRSALASRDLIGQAKGILMERFNINAVAAFELLRTLSQESNVKLVDIATDLVRVEHPTED